MSLDPSYAPNETSSEIWIEVSTLIGATTLSSTAFGILVALYVFCLSALIPILNKPSQRKWAIFHVVYCSILFILTGTGNSCNARIAQQYWINNRNFPGGPLDFILDGMVTGTLIWGWSVFIAASWLQDAYMVYRCFVFWNRNPFVCALPVLFFMGSVGESKKLTHISFSYFAATSLVFIVGTVESGRVSLTFAIIFGVWYILSVSINIIAMIAIVGRLLWKRREIATLLGKEHSKIYMGVVAILVESASLYSIFGIIFIVMHFRGDPSDGLVLPVHGALMGICPLMIIYRVASGRGWTSKTAQQLTTSRVAMRFSPNHGGPESMTNFSSHTIPTQPETPVDLMEMNILMKHETAVLQEI